MSSRWLRLGALALVIVALLVVSTLTHMEDRLPELARAAGPWGVPVLVVAFCVAAILHIPGLVMVAAAMLLYGHVLGTAVAVVGSAVGVVVAFFFIRAVGGQALAAIERPIVKRLLGRLDAHPVTTVAVLRGIFFMSGPLTTILALSSVRARAYVVGSVLGMVPAAALYALLFRFVFR